MAWKERGKEDSGFEVGGGKGVKLGVETDQLGLLGVGQWNWLSRYRATDTIDSACRRLFKKRHPQKKKYASQPD